MDHFANQTINSTSPLENLESTAINNQTKLKSCQHQNGMPKIQPLGIFQKSDFDPFLIEFHVHLNSTEFLLSMLKISRSKMAALVRQKTQSYLHEFCFIVCSCSSKNTIYWCSVNVYQLFTNMLSIVVKQLFSLIILHSVVNSYV